MRIQMQSGACGVLITSDGRCFHQRHPYGQTKSTSQLGVLALTLPWTTSVLLSPLGFFFGPVVAWNLSIAMILLAIGVSTAWLVRQLTDSWSIGCAMGGLVMTQPMLLHAISDGTPEHLSLWGVPLLLGMTWKAFTEISPKWGVGAGLMAVLVALDSPYHAIYAALTGLIVLPWSFIRRWKN